MVATVVGILGFLAFMTILVVLAYRSDRGPVPRRRENRRLRADLAVARTVIHDVEEKVALYGPSLDEVGAALAYDVREIIRVYNRGTLSDNGNKSD